MEWNRGNGVQHYPGGSTIGQQWVDWCSALG